MNDATPDATPNDEGEVKRTVVASAPKMEESETTVRPVHPAASLSAPRWRLVVTDGNSAGTTFDVEPGETIVGRGEGVALRLGDSGVSRRHARIFCSRDGQLIVCDLGSTNGTYVNDVRVQLSVVQAGCRIRIGPDAALRVEQAAGDADSVGLRPRELDVARLVAKGLTNPQIAEKLGIRRRTVASHLENAYRRLQIGSRAELARYVSSRDLL